MKEKPYFVRHLFYAALLLLLLCACDAESTQTQDSGPSDQETAGLVGTWANSFGSHMTILSQDSTGAFLGIYQSSTGSSGEYFFWGYSPEGVAGNQPLTLAIYWKDIASNTGSGDSTWHWVSMMTGVFYPQEPAIEVLHDMIATTEFAKADVYQPGHYTQTLVYTPVASDQEDREEVRPPDTSPAVDLASTWVNVDPSSDFSSLTIEPLEWAMLEGSINSGQGSTPFLGLQDISPTPGSGLTSVVFVADYRDQNGKSAGLSLGGWYNPQTDQLELRAFQSIAVDHAANYAAVNNLGTEVFARQ